MCKHGEYQLVMVMIPGDLSCTGRKRLKLVKIDKCIASIVRALQVGRIDTRASCCGHGEGDGKIELQDGRIIIIKI